MTHGTISALLIVVLWAPVARAQPTVTVTAESRIDLAVVRDATGTARVEGVLRDELGRGLPEQDITLDVEGYPPRALVTDARGRFDWTLPSSRGVFQVSATYGGQTLYAPNVVHREADLSRNDVRLSLSLAPPPEAEAEAESDTDREASAVSRIDLDADSARLRVRAVELGVAGPVPAVGLDVRVLSETQVPLGRGTTDEAGEIEIVVPTSRFGAVGRARIVARGAQDAQRAMSSAELIVLRYRATTLQASANPRVANEDEQVTVTGSLRDSQGPLRGAHVGLYGRTVVQPPNEGEVPADNPPAAHDRLPETHLATAMVDERGMFRMTVQLAGDAPIREWVVRFRSGDPGVLSSESSPLRIQVEARSASWPWLLVPLLLLGAAIVTARRRPRGAEALATPATAKAGIFVPKGSARKRHPKRDAITGVVLHHATGEPIHGAHVAVGETRTTSASDGRFTLTPPAGAGTLRVVAAGYIAQHSEISVPHRGEWTNVTVRLESLRDRALGAFRNVALRVLPSATSWSLTTNREVPAAVSERQRPALEALALETDALYYGPAAPDPEQIAALAELAEAVDDDPAAF